MSRASAIPHKQVSGLTWVAVPAQHGIGAYRKAMVTTACGQEVVTTLATRRDDRVRCPECRAQAATGNTSPRGDE